MAEKLTTEEIKKALECCKFSNDEGCLNCPLNGAPVQECADTLYEATLDLINRQQETIETLRKCVEQHHIIRKDGKSPLSLLTAEIRAEAIKAFVEKFDSAIDEMKLPLSNIVDKTLHIAKQLAHKIAKEMVGEQE